MSIAGIALLDFGLSQFLGINIIVEPWIPFLMVGLITVYAVYPMFGSDLRAAQLCKAIAQHFGLGCTLAVLSCLVAAFDFPLIDAALARADMALGISWIGIFNFVHSHQWITLTLTLGYNSIAVQPILLLFWLIGTRRFDRFNEFISLFALTLSVSIAISAVLPAAGAFVQYDVLSLVNTDYWTLLTGLRNGTINEVMLSKIDGIVTFPSFHTALGIIFTYAARNIRFLFPTIAATNVVLIGATPIIGGHYFVDVIAGAIITMVVITMTMRPRATAQRHVSAQAMP